MKKTFYGLQFAAEGCYGQYLTKPAGVSRNFQMLCGGAAMEEIKHICTSVSKNITIITIISIFFNHTHIG